MLVALLMGLEDVLVDTLIRINSGLNLTEITLRLRGSSTLGTRISHIYVIWETICVIW